MNADGIDVLTRTNHAIVDSLEPDIADAFNLSMKVNDCEMRWFYPHARRPAISIKLSPVTA